MKKHKLLIIVLLLLVVTACGDKGKEVQVEEVEVPKAAPLGEVAPASGEIPEAEATSQPVVIEGEADAGQSPLDLLGAIQPRDFDSMMVETDMFNRDGLQSTSVVYKKGMDTRTEIAMPDSQRQIVIALMDQGITYQYVEGARQGMKIIHGNSQEMMTQMEELGGQAEIPDVMELENQTHDHMIVRRDEVDGQKAIYVEFEDLDQDLDRVIVKMWYSEEYAYPLIYEFTINGEMVMRTEVKGFQVNVDFDDALFMPPETVDFMEIKMEN
jgi:outer membrane lipoprotein-sorting protein